jgi:autotransporter-associated beta strand protein
MTTKRYSLIYKALLILPAFLAFMIGGADAQVIWSSSTGNAWLTGSNWTGGVVPGPTAVAQFNANPTSASTGVGINMDTASGAYATGAVSVTSSRTSNLIIGNSSPTTPGIFTLNGATVGTTSNVILSNFASNTARLTIQNTQGSGASTMSLNIGSGSKNILAGSGTATGIGNTINITTAISGSAALTFLGSGTWDATSATGVNGGLLKLGGTNTFSGGITVGAADGTQSGILELDSVNAISNTATNNITINSNSQLYLAAPPNTTFSMGSLTLNLNGNGNGYSTTGKGALINLTGNSYVWDGPVNIASDAGITAAGTSTLTLTSNISGSGMLTKQGTGTLVLQGTNNTWTGGTTITTGRIIVSPGSGLSSGPLNMAQLSGSVTISLNNSRQSISSLSGSVTGSSNALILSGTRLTINQSTNTTFGGTASLNSSITGTGSVVKTGSGRLTLTSPGNTFSGGLKITQGEIRYNPLSATSATNNSADTLDGGTLSTNGIGRTFTFTFGTLALTQNSTIDLGSDTLHNIKFANSSAITWTSGKILTITNWTGSWNGTAGTKGRVYVGTNTTGLTSAQLNQVRFQDGSGHLYSATILSTGELVPVAPTITTTASSYGPFCNNTDNFISVGFTYSGTLSGPFLVQLSNASGVFPNDFTTNIIGSGSTSPITATIPSGTPGGSAYRIRVINAAPVNTFGSNNGANITITGTPALPAITGPATVPLGATVTLANSTTGGTWSSNNPAIASVNTTSGLVSGLTVGSTTITYSYTNSCGITGYTTTGINVVAIPSVISVTPNTAIPGATVTISGSSFNTTAANNIVFFGAARATVATASASVLTVTVPLGASFAHITVTDSTTGQAAFSPREFLPVYANSGLMSDSIYFKPAVNFTTGSLPIGVAMGDLDGDGKADMVVTNSGPNNMFVYRNTSTTGSVNAATFAAPVSISTGLGPHYIKIADLNADGKPEIIVANTATSSNSISIYRNTSTTGSISFAARVDISSPTAPIDLGIGDFDKDGRPDIAVVGQASASVRILQNQVSGTNITSSSFALATTLTTGTTPYKIYCGDLDNDGSTDIAVTNYGSGTVSLYHNTSSVGAMSFSAATTLTTGTAPTGIAGGDIDGDSNTDIITTNTGAQTISVFRNTNATAGTLSFNAGVTFATNAIPEDLVLADVNGDGKLDIAVGNYNSANVSVYRNMATSGAINAASLAAKVDLPCGTNPAGMAWNDVDNDGKADLAVVSGNSSYISILKNYPLPPVGTISGTDSVCAGSAATLTATVAGGYWQSTNTAVATVSAAGVVYAVAAGTDTILYYTVAQGDTNYAFHTITTGALVSVGNISASTNTICTGAGTALENTVAGGTWSSNATGIAVADTNGFVTGIATGTAIISYTTNSFCGVSYDTAMIQVTPGTGYVIGAILGPSSVCAGAVIALSDTSAGGAWSSSNLEIATVSGSGSVQGLAQGTVTITYAINTACGVYQAVRNITVDTLPDISVINGPVNLCAGVPTTYSSPGGPGGIWSTATGNATINATTGIATGITAGLDTVMYNITNTCGSTMGSLPIVITPQPDAGSLSGPAEVCKTDTITLISSIPGGTWNLSNSLATSLGNGMIKGINAGVDTVRYIIANTCGADTATQVITISAPPVAGVITGSTTTICVGSAITLTDTTSGGIWSTVNGNATVAGGVVTGVTPGTDTVQYIVTNVCGTAKAIKKVTINAITPVDTIAGPSSVCTGAKITLTNATTGGTWSKTNNTANISTSGVVTGISAGVDTIKYTPAGTCPMVATKAITINASPYTGSITGPSTVCVGDTIVLRDTVAGGVWSGTNGNTMVIDSFVVGVTPGADTVKFTIVTAMCGSTSAIKRITVNPLPFALPITGPSVVTVGETIQLRDSTTGGAWSVKGTNALVTANGKLGGLKEGIDTVKYSISNSCGTYSSLHPVTILAAGSAGSISAIELYPNPTSGKFTVKLVSTTDFNVVAVIAGADFRIIATKDMTTNASADFDLTLPDGVYFLSVPAQKGWFTTKFVIVH